jgi:two-component system response regulator HydG
MTLTPISKATLVAEFETILDALIESDFNKKKAAEILQVDRKTLYNKLGRHKELGTAKLRKIISGTL